MMNKLLANNTLMVLLFSAVLVLASVLILNWAFQSTLDRIEWKEVSHRVAPGENLWILASQYCPKRVDKREWIYEVRTLNGMQSSTVYPGQEIRILVPLEGINYE